MSALNVVGKDRMGPANAVLNSCGFSLHGRSVPYARFEFVAHGQGVNRAMALANAARWTVWMNSRLDGWVFVTLIFSVASRCVD